MLPVDANGCTSMMIADIAWTKNDLFVVVGFSSNYFCIISRLGDPVKILCDDGSKMKYFINLPPFDDRKKINKKSVASFKRLKVYKVYIFPKCNFK